MHSDEHSAALLQAAQHTMLAGLALSENGASCDLRERTVFLKARASKPRPRHLFMSMSTSQVKLILPTQIPNSPPLALARRQARRMSSFSFWICLCIMYMYDRICATGVSLVLEQGLGSLGLTVSLSHGHITRAPSAPQLKKGGPE